MVYFIVQVHPEATNYRRILGRDRQDRVETGNYILSSCFMFNVYLSKSYIHSVNILTFTLLIEVILFCLVFISI